MPKNPQSVRGHCYCNKIQFELLFPTEFCCHCHCEDCRQTHGAPLVTWTGLPKAQFRFLSGEPCIKKFKSHPGVFWWFCSECGTSLFADYAEAPEKIYVTVANLAGELDRTPDGHVSYEEHVPWLSFSDSLPKYRAKTKELVVD